MADAQILLWRSVQVGQVEELALVLPLPATVADAVRAAGWPAAETCGIWGRICAVNTLLHDGDRVELYRPLTVDPKIARRERFMQQGARGAGLFAARRAHSKAGY